MTALFISAVGVSIGFSSMIAAILMYVIKAEITKAEFRLTVAIKDAISEIHEDLKKCSAVECPVRRVLEERGIKVGVSI